MNECAYGWAECIWWNTGGICVAPNQGEDYCPCYTPEETVQQNDLDSDVQSFVSKLVRRFLEE